MSASEKELDIYDEFVVTEGRQLSVNGKNSPDRNGNESTLQEVINPIIMDVSETVSNGGIDTKVKQMMETPIVKEMVIGSIANEGVEILTVKEELETPIISLITDYRVKTTIVKEEMKTNIAKEGMKTTIFNEGDQATVFKEEVETSTNKKEVEKGEFFFAIYQDRDLFVGENESIPVPKLGGNNSNIKKKLDSSIIEELIDIPKKRARMDTVFEKDGVEVPVNKGIESEGVVKPDNEEEVETVKEEQKIIEIPVVEKELAISIANDMEDTSKNSNSILDDEQRVVLAPTKIDKNISFIKELVRETDFPNWNDINYDEPYTTIELDPSSWEYKNIYNKFDRDCYPTIIDIKRVRNPFLYTQYHLKKNQKRSINGKVTEHNLFHGTKDYNEDSICKNNLDYRKMGCYGYVFNKFGNGVSFATNSTYAKDYPRGSSSLVRTMFVVKVLETTSCPGRSGLIIPPEPADIAVSRNVYVKFFDNEFYPEYIVHYEL